MEKFFQQFCTTKNDEKLMNVTTNGGTCTYYKVEVKITLLNMVLASVCSIASTLNLKIACDRELKFHSSEKLISICLMGSIKIHL